MTPEEKQEVLDEEHLRLLALFHYIFGGITVAFALLGSLWVVVATTMFAALPANAPDGVNENIARQLQVMQGFMLVFVGMMVVAGVVYGVLQIVAGRCISQRRGRIFTVIVSLPRVLFFPYGTLLTIFTLMVLERGSVQQRYRRHAGL